jgi:hypothetical protein
MNSRTRTVLRRMIKNPLERGFHRHTHLHVDYPT